MTLTVAWVRTRTPVPQLVFASDSRLTGGATWDSAPKIFTLPRSDCLISFAGGTYYAYPLVLQLINAIEAYAPSREHRHDVTRLRSHVLRVFNSMREDVKGAVEVLREPDVEFLFGGYSWRYGEFRLWRIFFSTTDDRFVYHPVPTWRGATWLVRFAGEGWEDAKAALVARLAPTELLDMEPFEVLRDIVRANAGTSVGGPPQVVKVYPHMNTQRFGVLWPDKDGAATVAGRTLLSYERVSLPLIDPDRPGVPRTGAGATPAIEVVDEPIGEADDRLDGVEVADPDA